MKVTKNIPGCFTAAEMADKIGAATGLKLRTIVDTDAVNGYVNTFCRPDGTCDVTIVVYEGGEKKDASDKSTWSAPKTIPTPKQLEAAV